MPPPPDRALAVLARLRRFEVAAGRRRLAEAIAAGVEAELRRVAAATALQGEAAAGDAGAYAAWLPRGLAERDRAAAALHLAEERVAGARAALTAARTAERVVELLQERQDAATRRTAARRAQAALDEAAIVRTRPDAGRQR